MKRAPISREYVTALENRIEALEGFLLKVKAASRDERGVMIDSIGFGNFSLQTNMLLEWSHDKHL